MSEAYLAGGLRIEFAEFVRLVRTTHESTMRKWSEMESSCTDKTRQLALDVGRLHGALSRDREELETIVDRYHGDTLGNERR